jgi:hypothetical protein
MSPASFEGTDAVPYRPLKREDFRGSRGYPVPANEEAVPSTVCTKIVARPGHAIARSAGGAYVASLEAPSFYAVMGRTCSRWLAGGDLSEEHVLEHGQIHFAITELEARRLNARAEDIVRQIHSAGTDPTNAAERANETLQQVVERAEKAARDRGMVFDQQVKRDRARQRAWFHKITNELDVTMPYARPPQTPPAAASAIPPVAASAIPPVAASVTPPVAASATPPVAASATPPVANSAAPPPPQAPPSTATFAD